MIRSTPIPKIIVVGSSNTDLVLSCRELPKPGETLLGGDFKRYAGGKGANQAVAAARAGAPVIFIGARGDDDLGQTAASVLEEEGINVQNFKVLPKVSSGVALILLGGKQKENMIAVARSANDLITPAHIKAARRFFAKAGAVVTQLETPLPAVLAAARLAQELSIPFLLNPAPATALSPALLKCVHTLTPNEHEALLLTGAKTIEGAGEILLKKGCQQVIVTLGAKGAQLFDHTGSRHFSAPKVKVVDTVGAGDCFTGWLAVGLSEKLPIDVNIQRALGAASLSVTRHGAQTGMPYRKEIK